LIAIPFFAIDAFLLRLLSRGRRGSRAGFICIHPWLISDNPD
jgi:hypothetical protein